MSLAARPHHFAAAAATAAAAPSCLSLRGSSRGVSHSGRIVSVRAAAGGQKPADSSSSAKTATTTGGEGEKMGVIIVDHGSRRQASNLLLEEFVRMYREETGRPIVELAHMEISEPSIEVAFGRCVEQGATLVAVSPFFLSPGRHWQEDIPTLTAEAAANHPGVGYFVAAPLGLHPLMTTIVDSRLETCLAHLTSGGGACDVCDGTKFGCKLVSSGEINLPSP